ncbi:hypothetical protein D9M69_587230 [compost metagenome]
MIGQPGIIKLLGLFFTQQLFYTLAYTILLPFIIDTQHIPFLQHPSAQSNTTQQYVFTFLIYDALSRCFQKTLCRYGHIQQEAYGSNGPFHLHTVHYFFHE